MPEPFEVHATLVASLSSLENLLRFHIKEAQPHRAMSHDPFHVPASATAAESLLLIQAHDGVSALPHTRSKRISPVSNPVAQGPHANQRVQLSNLRRQPR